MKMNEEIGREFCNLVDIGLIPTLITHGFNIEMIGAAARKAVGECPRMMVEGMTAEEIEDYIGKAWNSPNRAKEDWIYSKFAAKTFHFLANTPLPVVDPDALAKAAVEAFRNSGAHDYPNWAAMYEAERNGWRAVAKMMEERK